MQTRWLYLLHGGAASRQNPRLYYLFDHSWLDHYYAAVQVEVKRWTWRILATNATKEVASSSYWHEETLFVVSPLQHLKPSPECSSHR
jgi:hypothetical protein